MLWFDKNWGYQSDDGGAPTLPTLQDSTSTGKDSASSVALLHDTVTTKAEQPKSRFHTTPPTQTIENYYLVCFRSSIPFVRLSQADSFHTEVYRHYVRKNEIGTENVVLLQPDESKEQYFVGYVFDHPLQVEVEKKTATWKMEDLKRRLETVEIVLVPFTRKRDWHWDFEGSHMIRYEASLNK